jgi:hypothetical protein
LERTDDGWKEVKLGAVYDLIACVRQGQPVRVVGATTYTATLAAAQDFGRQVLAIAHRRGVGWAHHVAVAASNWRRVIAVFPPPDIGDPPSSWAPTP